MIERRLCRLLVFIVLTCIPTARVFAQAAPEERKTPPRDTKGYTQTSATPDEGQASSTVSRDELDQRQPRSAPDALRYEPGVFVQQTAHSQGSAYIRGRTGQQTVLLYDDIRLNNSLFRQGPNQYFFTIDSRTIHHIDIIRGSASTRYGTDAISGAINAKPLEPAFTPNNKGLQLNPSAAARWASADDELGGRLQLNMQWDNDVALLVGMGYRDVDQLESGGPVLSPRNGEPAWVPRFEEDGRTMVGTGFNEFTADARLVIPLEGHRRLTAAYYDYRQFDAPRTDNCPPPEAPYNECLKYDEQYRQLAYLALDGRWGGLAEKSRLILSFQRQHERRTHERPSSYTVNGGRDDVSSWGLLWRAQTERLKLGEEHSLMARWGADAYRDQIESVAWLIFTDNDITIERSRGQYIDGSRYATVGAWGEAELRLWHQLNLRAGMRGSHINVFSPGDETSATARIKTSWSPLVGNVGAEWWVNPWLTLLASADQGFRAPNLDDLTSRQRTGPGYQIENAALTPESGWTTELGVRLNKGPLELDVWGYRATLQDTIARIDKQAKDCPPSTPDCNNSRTYLQLVNLAGTSEIWGAEGGLKLRLPHHIRLATTLSWAWGSTPSTVPGQPDLRPPVSRIPPLNGTAEALYKRPEGLYLGAALRWATKQDRLAISDMSDPRIPMGGTPGFQVLDLRAGYRLNHKASLNAVFENVFDSAYRYHGSTVNGPGRGLIINLTAGL